MKEWVKNIVGGFINSKKTIATVCTIATIGVVNQKYALYAFIVWMVCQTAVDMVRVYKGEKK